MPLAQAPTSPQPTKKRSWFQICPRDERGKCKPKGTVSSPAQDQQQIEGGDEGGIPLDWALWEECDSLIPEKMPDQLPAVLGDVDDGVKVVLTTKDKIKDLSGSDFRLDHIPKDEIWLAIEAGWEDLPFNLFHEALERRYLKWGKKPSEAHDLASETEGFVRQKLKDAGIKSLQAPKAPKRLKVRYVDAETIRNTSYTNQEFSNWAMHEDFPNMIPEGEVWIDRNADPVDRSYYWIDAQAMVRARSQGQSEYQSGEYGTDVERAERTRKTRGGEGDRPNHDENPPDLYVARWKVIHTDGESIEAWIVDGRKVREMRKTDFVEGGHAFIYPFIPENEIWIENVIEEDEREFILLHELTERRMMKHEREDYDEAHRYASRLEFEARQKAGKKDLICETCPQCGCGTKSDGFDVWCKGDYCEYRGKVPALSAKALSWLSEGSGGALVPPPAFGLTRKKNPQRAAGDWIKALRSKYRPKNFNPVKPKTNLSNINDGWIEKFLKSLEERHGKPIKIA